MDGDSPRQLVVAAGLPGVAGSSSKAKVQEAAKMDDHPVARWHRLLEQRNPRELEEFLAEDAVFLSPIMHKPQQGRVLTIGYLAAALQVLGNDSFHYVREIIGPSDAMLEFETTIDGTLINGVDIIKWNEQGKVVEFKVMLRPLKAINLVHERMAAMLQERRAP
jgi:hypothetical protein